MRLRWSPRRVYSAWTIMRSIAIAKCSSTSAPMVSESGDAVSIGDCFMLASHGNWMRNGHPGPVIMLCFWLVHCKVGISNSAHLVPAELNELTILTDTYRGKLMEACTRPEPLLFETWHRGHAPRSLQQSSNLRECLEQLQVKLFWGSAKGFVWKSDFFNLFRICRQSIELFAFRFGCILLCRYLYPYGSPICRNQDMRSRWGLLFW